MISRETRSRRILSLKPGEYSQQVGDRSSRGRRQIESFGQRDETDSEIAEFLESSHQVSHRASPTVQPPDHDDIVVTAPRGI